MRCFILICGSIVGLMASLPWPWRVRVFIAKMIQQSLRVLLAWYPGLYRFVIGENTRYGMGKQQDGEMESIMGMEMVVCEAERRGVSPERIKVVLDDARAAGVKDVDLFRFLCERLFGEEAHSLLKRIVAF
jgi:hypothetical protein